MTAVVLLAVLWLLAAAGVAAAVALARLLDDMQRDRDLDARIANRYRRPVNGRTWS